MAEAQEQGTVSNFLDWVFQKPKPATPVAVPGPTSKRKKANKPRQTIKAVGLVAVVVVGTAVVAKHFGVNKEKVKSWVRNLRSFNCKKLLPGQKSVGKEGEAAAV